MARTGKRWTVDAERPVLCMVGHTETHEYSRQEFVRLSLRRIELAHDWFSTYEVGADNFDMSVEYPASGVEISIKEIDRNENSVYRSSRRPFRSRL